ncbi:MULTISPECIES: sigma factor [unclassified Streptomyces]|uniref:sigma factor n=1 Tax=unclassified Streptomyces TaxID=2593676 RepID=UPI003323EA48
MHAAGRVTSGIAEEAEEAVQDAYLRWSRADRVVIDHPGAWLARVVTNLCLNRTTSARWSWPSSAIPCRRRCWDIAGVLDLSEANCRQLYRRAVQRVATPEARFTPAAEQQRELVESFVTAAREGDLAGLEKLLAEDVTGCGSSSTRTNSASRAASSLPWLPGREPRASADAKRLSHLRMLVGSQRVTGAPPGSARPPKGRRLR